MNLLSEAQVKESITLLRGRSHGDGVTALEERLGLRRGEMLDLSASMNPVAPDFRYILEPGFATLGRYPDLAEAEDCLAGVLEVDPRRLVLCNGGSEAIQLVSLLVHTGRVREPDFGLYNRHISTYDPKGPWWASNPNNPTGVLLEESERPFVVDEAYYQMATGRWTRRDFEHGSFVVGSLTKLFSLPGLRMGYIVAPTVDQALKLKSRQAHWPLNSMASSCLKGLLEVIDLAGTKSSIASLREELKSLLYARGYEPQRSDANYLYVPSAGELFEKLLMHKIVTRDTSSFGMAGGVRIAVPSEVGLERIKDALAPRRPLGRKRDSFRGSLMVVGTSSDSGKSTIVTAFCRILSDRGISVAPFKSQNMALNSAVTPSGHEIGRAQARQALAARVAAEVAMNPILLKPTSSTSSQVVVNGVPVENLSAREYQKRKSELIEVALSAYRDLRSRFEVIVLEGAGSPAEINLLDNDIVNLGLARRTGSRALLVGDIERGGVFASLYGTLRILDDGLSSLIEGFVINKISGDASLLETGIKRLEELTLRRVFGVVPLLDRDFVDNEDSLGLLGYGDRQHKLEGALDVVVIALPKISNYTDFDPLLYEPSCSVRLVRSPSQLGDPDMVIVPGSKSTVSDLAWLRSSGFERAMRRLIDRGTTLLGVCGGYQMIGRDIEDHFESGAGLVEGLGLLDASTRFLGSKVTLCRTGVCEYFGDVAVDGYQIHQGRVLSHEPTALFHLDPPVREIEGVACSDGAVDKTGQVYGTTLHAIFENDGFRVSFLRQVALRRGKYFDSSLRFRELRENQIDELARVIEHNIDVDAVLRAASIRIGD